MRANSGYKIRIVLFIGWADIDIAFVFNMFDHIRREDGGFWVSSGG